MTRRGLLQVSGAVLISAGALGGCDWFSAEPTSGDADETRDRTDRQAPSLKEQVDAGELPPLEERLPDSPLVVEPVDRIGVYGGTLSSALLGTSTSHLYSTAGYDQLLTWTPAWTGAAGSDELEPNVVESFDVNDDATEFTFQLRRGMRWSDGEPFTADDIVFLVDDVFLNEELFPAPPPSISVEGEPGSIEKLDDHSFRITFPRPAGLFLHELAHPRANMFTRFPKHYLSQFHPTYNPDVDQLVEEEGLDGWVDLFGAKTGMMWEHAENAELPTLWAWQVTTRLGEGPRVVLERNPYYWKVDTDGNQLPYIDRMTFDIVDNAEVMLLNALNGEYTLEASADTRFTSPKNKPILARSREDGNYRFVDASETRMNVMCIYLNLTHQDEVKREIFGNLDFRIGLSHAINRQEIIDVTMQQQGEPFQVAPLPESAFFDEEFATQYLEYDTSRAEEALDRAFPDRNDEGIRLGPDGSPISFVMEYVPEFRPEWTDMLELIRDSWAAVGVEMQLQPMDRSLFGTRIDANEHDAAVWHGDGGIDILQQPKNYFPTGSGSHHAVSWGIWYESGGADGEEPPEGAREQMELFDRLSASADPEEQTQLMTEILRIAKEQFHVIGIARETEKYFIASNDLHNLPDTMIQGWTYPTPGPSRPQQYFIDS